MTGKRMGASEWGKRMSFRVARARCCFSRFVSFASFVVVPGTPHAKALRREVGRLAGGGGRRSEAWCLVLGASCLVLGAWCLVLGALCLVRWVTDRRRCLGRAIGLEPALLFPSSPSSLVPCSNHTNDKDRKHTNGGSAGSPLWLALGASGLSENVAKWLSRKVAKSLATKDGKSRRAEGGASVGQCVGASCVRCPWARGGVQWVGKTQSRRGQCREPKTTPCFVGAHSVPLGG
jgi:hypothetical protein